MRFLGKGGSDERIGCIRTGKADKSILNVPGISIFLKDRGVFSYSPSKGMFTLFSWKYGLIGFPGSVTRKK